MKFGKLVFPAFLIALLAGCGYRLAAKKGDAGAGQSIAVPTFANSTSNYRIEQSISEAIRKELARNTHYKVTSGDTGDLVLRGEVLGYGTTPTVLDEGGRAAQYAVSIVLKVLVTETATGKHLFQNDAMVFRETFQLSRAAGDFVPEDPAALQRLATQFASSLTANLVHR